VSTTLTRPAQIDEVETVAARTGMHIARTNVILKKQG
jgi:hypothetical protein